MNIAFLADLLLKIYELIKNIAGYDDEVASVFKGLVEFFGGTFVA